MWVTRKDILHHVHSVVGTVLESSKETYIPAQMHQAGNKTKTIKWKIGCFFQNTYKE